jgi:hypothetical protein
MTIRAGSQNARILAVLWDGQRHTVPEIHRRAGGCRLNSRISELRRHGCEIECDRDPRRKGAGAYGYRLVATPPGLEPPPEQAEWARMLADAEQRRASVPRDAEHRLRLYGIRDGDVLDVLGTAATAADLGVLIVELGRRGGLHHLCLGVLDTFGRDTNAGTWLVNPWEGR